MPEVELTEEESALTMCLLRLFAGKLEFVRFIPHEGDEDVLVVIRGQKPKKGKKSLLVGMPDDALRKEFD